MNVNLCNINMSILASIYINMYLVVHECLCFSYSIHVVIHFFVNPGTRNYLRKVRQQILCY